MRWHQYQSLLLTILQLASGRKIDRARAKFLVNNAGTLLCYDAPLLPPDAAVPVWRDACQHYAQECAQECALEPAQQDDVRAACAKFIRDAPEYVVWLGVLLTGSKQSEGYLKGSGNSGRMPAISSICADSPLIFLV